MTARLLFNVSAVAEVLTGIALLVAPEYVVGLLLGNGLSSTGTAVTRVLGIGLLSLGVAVAEIERSRMHQAARAGICIYNVGVAGLLMILGMQGEANGDLLWPAAGLHGFMGAPMLYVLLAPSRSTS